MVKKKIIYVLGLLFFIYNAGMVTSCSRGYGCGQEEKYNNPNLESGKRGKSSLFSKSQKKKMKLS